MRRLIDHLKTARPKGLTSVKISGRTFHVGLVDCPMRTAAEPYTRLIEGLYTRGGDPVGDEANTAKAQIVALLLGRDAPDVTAAWLSRHMSKQQREALLDEFLRQAVELANARPRG